MAVKLTNRYVESLRAEGRRICVRDAIVPGLELRVSPSGARTWSVLYRHRTRRRRLTLGNADVVPLADARERAREALRTSTKGTDPGDQKKIDRNAATFALLVEDYLTKHAKRKKRSWKGDERIANVELLPHWQHRAVREITRRDIIDLVDAIAERGVPVLANRTVALISKLFSFALNQSWIDASPAMKIPRPATETRRDRVLDEHEVRRLWKALDDLDAPLAAFFKLRLLTAQRGQEVNTMRWQDVDLHAGWWTIPAEVTKNKLAHRVPLSPAAVDLITTLQPADDDKRRPIFVLDRGRGKRQQSEAMATLGLENFRGHDLRRTAATLMTSGGVPRLVVSKILNHAEPSVTAIYDRASYDSEKRSALDWWAIRLKAILTNKRSKVVPFARVSA
jgi:integrase